MGLTKCLEIVADHKSELGECPVWDNKTNSINWIDILKGEVHEYTASHDHFKTLTLGQMIGSVSICEDGNYIAALKHGVGFIERGTGKISIISNPEPNKKENRFNDGKCDPQGRFWAGSMSLSGRQKAGSLYVLDGLGNLDKIMDKISISNGLAWSRDQKTFYFIDTPTLKVSAFDYDGRSGHISNRRAVIRFIEGEGYPDGMTIDEEGMLWIAHWDGWQVARWDPGTGKKLDSFKLPVSRITSCAFGGDTFEDLYITTARTGLSKQELREQPNAGALFVIKNCGYRGRPENKYKNFSGEKTD